MSGAGVSVVSGFSRTGMSVVSGFSRTGMSVVSGFSRTMRGGIVARLEGSRDIA